MREKQRAELRAALAGFPPVQNFVQSRAAGGEDAGVQQAEAAQVQHDFRHAAREEHAHGRVMHGPVRQHAYEARHAAVHGNPILDRRAPQASGVGDGGDVQE